MNRIIRPENNPQGFTLNVLEVVYLTHFLIPSHEPSSSQPCRQIPTRPVKSGHSPGFVTLNNYCH